MSHRSLRPQSRASPEGTGEVVGRGGAIEQSLWSLPIPTLTSCQPFPRACPSCHPSPGPEPGSGAPEGCGPALPPCCSALLAVPGPVGSPALAPGCCPVQPPASSPPAAHGPGGGGRTDETLLPQEPWVTNSGPPPAPGISLCSTPDFRAHSRHCSWHQLQILTHSDTSTLTHVHTHPAFSLLLPNSD